MYTFNNCKFSNKFSTNIFQSVDFLRNFYNLFKLQRIVDFPKMSFIWKNLFRKLSFVHFLSNFKPFVDLSTFINFLKHFGQTWMIGRFPKNSSFFDFLSNFERLTIFKSILTVCRFSKIYRSLKKNWTFYRFSSKFWPCSIFDKVQLVHIFFLNFNYSFKLWTIVVLSTSSDHLTNILQI